MKKRYFIELMCFIFILIFPFLSAEKNIEIDVLHEVVSPYLDFELMEMIDDEKIYRNYHVNKNSYDDCFSYSPISYMDVEEITLFKVADASRRKTVFDAAKQHIEKEISIFEGYGIRQTELLKKAVIKEKGMYVIIIVHPQGNMINQEIEGCF